MPIRTFKTVPSFARAAVAATNSWRASLEPGAVKMIAAQFGDVYDRRWEKENLGWLFGAMPAPQDPSARAGGAGGRGGLEPLPWRHSRGKDTGGKAPEAKPLSDRDENEIAAFHAALGILPETDEPPTGAADTGSLPGANEPSARSGAASDAPIGWQGKAVQILRQAGSDTWMSAGEVRDALAAEGTDMARQTVSTALARMARRHQIRVRGTGPNTVYAARDSTGR